ncbi:hypothetical protein [Paraburkholderia sp.]|uniref:hypothetical protein n=1 Tax=Paraburkholderia sp. TaxID=1926495 RepID=UPI002B481E60|nr:hypothetical protein [Paraburkholderia sp.]
MDAVGRFGRSANVNAIGVTVPALSPSRRLPDYFAARIFFPIRKTNSRHFVRMPTVGGFAGRRAQDAFLANYFQFLSRFVPLPSCQPDEVRITNPSLRTSPHPSSTGVCP